MTISFYNAPSFKVLLLLLCCLSLNTSFAQDCDNLTSGGTISGDESGCNSPTFDPSIITSTAPAIGGTGTIEYMWMKTTGDPNSPFNTWQIIPGATGESYDPTPISQTTYYGRCSRRSGCTEYIGETNFVVKTIRCCGLSLTGIGYGSSCADNNGKIIVTPNGATGTVSYTWSESSIGNISNPTGLTLGTYSVTATDDAGCSAIASFSVTTPASLSAQSTTSNASCGAAVGSASITVSGGTAPYSYRWNDSNNQTTSTATNLAPGTYTVTITDISGCSITNMATIGSDSGLMVTLTTTSTLCNGDNSGTIAVNVLNGEAPFNYAWNNSLPNLPGFNSLAQGLYMVTVTDRNGCSGMAEAKLHGADSLIVTPVVENASCEENDGRIRLDIRGGAAHYTFEWSAPLEDNDNPFATNLAPGAYEYTVTDENGCMVSDVVIVGQEPGCNPTGPCIVNGGLISTTDPTTICGGDNVADVVTVSISNNVGSNSRWVITNENGIILSLPISNIFNFDEVGLGTCLIWNITYNESITGLNVGNNVNAVTGCMDFSNSIRVVRQDCPPTECNLTTSVISTNDETVVCVGDGSTDNVSINLTPGNGDFSRFIITDTSATIIAISTESTFNFETANPGICILWNITYNDGIGGLEAGNKINNITGCYRLSNAITIVRQDCQTDPCSTFNGSISINSPANSSACAGTDIRLSTSPSNANYTYSWSATAGSFDDATSATPTYSMMVPGTYSIVVTVTNGNCVTTDTTTVTILPAPEVILAVTDNECAQNNAGSISATVSGGVSPYTYAWNNGSTSKDLSNLSAGTYSLTVTAANGCRVISSATITQGGTLAVTIDTPTNICSDSSTGSLNATVTGGQAPFTYNWSNGGTTATLTNLAAGNYTLTVTDNNGCTETATATIIEDEAFSVNIIGSSLMICPGEPISLGISPANPNLSYTWTTTGGSLDDNTSSSPIYSMITPGTYDVTVVASNGNCTATSTKSITIYSGINISATLSDVVCAGANNGSISITAASDNAPLTYTWDNGIGNTANPTDLAPGNYNLTITDAVNCSITQSFTIGTISNLSLSLASSNLDCNGANNGTITATTAGGVEPITYTWSNGGANAATINNLAAGTYSVTATDAMGCTQTQSTELTEPTPLFVTIVNSAEGQTICPGTSVNLTASPNDANLTYNWTATGGTFDDATSATPVFTMMMPGSYDITLSVSDGTCAATATTTVIIGEGIDFTVNKNDISCSGETDGRISLTINSGAAPVIYAWDGGIGNNPNPTGLAAGTYNLTLTDANGCQATTSITIEPVNQIDIALDGTNILCNGDASGSANALVVGGTSPLLLAWSNGASGNGINNLVAGTYSLTVTDANGCTAVESVTLTESPALNLVATGENIGCENLGNASVTVTGGTAPYTYLWNDGASQTSASASNLVAGDYTVTVTDANSCQSTATVSIISTDGISCTINVVNDIETIDGTEGELNVTATGGSGNYTYSWNNGGTNSNITNLGSDTFIVTVTDDEGCQCVDSVTLYNPAILGNFVFIDTDSSGTQDAGEPGVEGVTLQLTGTTTYGEMIVKTTVTDANGFYQFPVPPGDYKVTVVDALGYNFTSTNTGGDDAIDSDFDPTTGMSQVVTLGPNESNLTIDLGLLVGETSCNNVLLGGAIQADETLCSSDADPSIITNLSFPTGGMGQLEYLWLKSDITKDYYPGHPAWKEIPNSNAPDYNPGVITKTTYFIRCTRRAGCDSYPGESNIITKTVVDCVTSPSAENLKTTIIDGQISLEWEGKIPANNGYFIIEKRESDNDFKVCGTLKSTISETMEVFHFMDSAPSFGENYYRIKTLAPSMPITFSNVAMAKIKQSANQRVMVYPNPVQKELTVHFLEELDEMAQIQVISGFGQIIKTLEVDTANKKHNVDLSDLPSGMYYLKFNNRKLKRFGHKIYKIEE